MDAKEREQFVDAWIVATEAGLDSPDWDKNKQVIYQMSDLPRDDPEEAWKVILAVNKRRLSDRVMESLAAGPIEDLLAKHGPAFIDRVEELAHSDPSFNELLGGVWQNRMTAKVWQRVQAVRRDIW